MRRGTLLACLLAALAATSQAAPGEGCTGVPTEHSGPISFSIKHASCIKRDAGHCSRGISAWSFSMGRLKLTGSLGPPAVVTLCTQTTRCAPPAHGLCACWRTACAMRASHPTSWPSSRTTSALL